MRLVCLASVFTCIALAQNPAIKPPPDFDTAPSTDAVPTEADPVKKPAEIPNPVPANPLLSPPLAVRTDPTLKQFPRELLRNFAALLSTQNLPPLLVGAAATGLAKIPNERVETFFASKAKYPFHEGGDFMGLAYVAGPTIAGLMLAGRKSDDARFRSFTYSLAQGFVINQTISHGIKMAVRSERPNGANMYSFPSGHTAGAFTWATTVNHYYGWKAGLPAYLAATYVGFARMDDHAHRLTDVLAGAALGYIVGSTVSRRANPHRALDWNLTVPAGGGVAATLQYHPGRR